MKKKEPDGYFVNELTKAQSKMRAYLAKILANCPATDDVCKNATNYYGSKEATGIPQLFF